jgi:hypothetical protein
MPDDIFRIVLDTANSEPTLERLKIKLVETEVAAANVGKTAGVSGEFGRGIMGASYAIQDFTSVLGTQGLGRALGAIQNNIPILVTSLGAGAGLAGAISIVSVGVGLLIDNWAKIHDYWTGGETEKEAERMKKLKEAIKEAKEEAEKLVKTLPPEQRQAGKDIKRAVDEFGGPAVKKELIEAMKAERGDFGKEAMSAQADTLIANLLKGDPAAIRYLSELDLRGDIGKVLQGGETPTESAKRRGEAAQKRLDEKDKKMREYLDRQKKAEQESLEEAADMRTKMMQDKEKFKEEQRKDQTIKARQFFEGAKPMTGRMPGPEFLKMLPRADRTPEMAAALQKGQALNNAKDQEKAIEKRLERDEAMLTQLGRAQQDFSHSPQRQRMPQQMQTQIMANLTENQRGLQDEIMHLRHLLHQTRAVKQQIRDGQAAGKQ